MLKVSYYFLFLNIINIEPGFFEKKVMNKKYRGKSDKVGLYKIFQNDRKKRSALKK